VQTALRNVLEPIFEQGFAEHSYGFRPQRSAKDALRRVTALLRQGYGVVVDADLKSYFDSIPHDRLMDRVRAHVVDGRVLSLLEAFLAQPILEGLKGYTPPNGTPQGAVISPLLSNIYLDPLDHLIASRRWRIVRYADDLVILCRSGAEAAEALEVLRQWVDEHGLQLHPDKTRIVDMTRGKSGFDFLGYHFERGVRSGRLKRWPSRKSLDKFKNAIRHKTHRCNGHSLPEIISRLNASLPGWFAYFQHSDRYTFTALDGWIRMRLRSILRKRQRRRGHGYGPDHLRWPNAYFRQLGLYSLMDAWIAQRQGFHPGLACFSPLARRWFSPQRGGTCQPSENRWDR
jgi:RNA-directed DNA polymerase